MIGCVEYLADLRHLLPNQSLDPHLQSHIRRAAALTPAAHSYEYVVVLNIQQLNEPPVRSHSRIDHLVEDLLYSQPYMLRRQSITFSNLGRWIKKGSDRCADSFTQLAPILRASLGDVDQVIVELDLHDAWNLEQLIGQVVVLRFFSGLDDGRPLVHGPIDCEAANVNVLPIDFSFDLNR